MCLWSLDCLTFSLNSCSHVCSGLLVFSVFTGVAVFNVKFVTLLFYDVFREIAVSSCFTARLRDFRYKMF